MKRKNLIICCDGTWQHASQQFPTNVAKVARSVSAVNDDGVPQIVFYSEGVGTERGVIPALSNKLGGAFGLGLDDNVVEAYRFIAANFEPNDSLFLFGFSRGATTVRSLAGLIHHVGILKRENLHHESKVMDEYRNKQSSSRERALFERNECHDMGDNKPIAFLGVWDTVKALGLPDFLPNANQWNKKYHFHDLSLVPAIKAARHAVSLDEDRNMFPPTLWKSSAIDEANEKAEIKNVFQQKWFCGDHGGVGGGMKDGRLSNIALLWVVEGAREAGLAMREPALKHFKDGCERPENIIRLNEKPKTSWFNRLPYSLGGYSARKGLQSENDLHASVNKRTEALPKYTPLALSKLADNNKMLS
ncbi:MAG: DUF2235 domain-containing protein [Pseudomonadota bacterium]